MKEAYVSFETAKLLKEKGFTIPSDTSYEEYLWQMYDESGKVHWGVYNNDWYFRITQQMACRWLREEKNIDIIPFHERLPNGCYWCRIEHKLLTAHQQFPIYSTYEDAVEAALQYVLNNLI